MTTRRRVGEAGERLAALLLARHGVRTIATNVTVGRGEIDILARDGDILVAVEVRTITGDHDPLLAFDRAKAEQVERLGRAVGADRVDLVALKLTPRAAEMRWVPGMVGGR